MAQRHCDLRQQPLFKLAIILAGLAALALVCFNWQRLRSWGPVLITIFYAGPDQSEKQGTSVLRDTSGDALLILSPDSLTQVNPPSYFEQVSWNYAWSNFLEQATGNSFAIADWNSLSVKDVLQRRLIIIASSAAAGTPSPEMLHCLYQFAEDGGCLVLETPSPAWRYLSGGVLESEPSNTCGGSSKGSVLSFENMPHNPYCGPQEAEIALAASPVFTFVHATAKLDQKIKKVGSIGNAPAIWQRSVGRGWIITLAFDLGIHLQAMQQGVPIRHWTAQETTGLVPSLVEAQDLALSRDMIDNDYPYADMLEDWLAGYCDGALRLWPRWWRFPYAYDGILSVTHDEENLGPQAFARLWELEDRLQLRSTIFQICNSASDAQRWTEHREPYCAPNGWTGKASQAITWGVHWNRFWPYLPLIQQREYACFPRRNPHFSRIHFLLWGRSYPKPWRNLAAAGIAMDSSYGPNRFRGYLFGTGLPFQAIDSNGLPLGVWEWPFETQENWSGVNAEYLEKLIEESAVSYHQAIVVLLHPHRWVAQEKGREFLSSIAKAAAAHRHWLANFNDYWDFMQSRARARIHSWTDSGELQAIVYAPASGMAILLHGSAKNIKINGRPATVRPLRFNGELHWLVAIPSGNSRLTAEYK